jgi:hypothetical protein
VIDGGIFHQVMEKLSTDALSYCFYYSFFEVSGIHSRVLGLGLYISNNIVTSLGGHIDVESTTGRGTRFVAHLPAAAPLAPGSIATPGEKVGNPMVDPVTL